MLWAAKSRNSRGFSAYITLMSRTGSTSGASGASGSRPVTCQRGAAPYSGMARLSHDAGQVASSECRLGA